MRALTIHLVRMDELRQRLIEGRAAQPVGDVATGEMFTESIDAMAAVALVEKVQYERDLEARAQSFARDRMASDPIDPDDLWACAGSVC